MDIEQVRVYFTGLRVRILNALERFDGQAFRRDPWPQGISCVIEEGDFFERGGVNYSHVGGEALPAAASARHPQLAGSPWQALGVSLVLHPRNPYCPTAHANVRFFLATPREGAPVWWFGGGMDLTPYYAFDDDVIHFHRCCKAALDPFGAALYPQFKKQCDAYFFLKHRNEARGVGGIFFDDFNDAFPLTETGLHWNFKRCFALMQAVGDAFVDAYLPICKRRRAQGYGERERDFQAYRRGRYVEFNLAQDRGTQFGLDSGGRTESILMSLPPLAKWRYQWQPEQGSAEERLTSHFLQARDWLETA